MKATLKKLKRVESQIKETREELVNIKAWNGAYCKPGEKEAKACKYNHWLGELQETKARLLKLLAEEVAEEILKIEPHAAVN